MSALKKAYKKPKIIIEEFSPQEVLCACAVVNTVHSEADQCAFLLEGTNLMIFAQSWSSCLIDGKNSGYCYQAGVNNVFSS